VKSGPWRIDTVDETGSTNADLLARAAAGEDIDGAVLINPFNIDGFVSAIRVALEMPTVERRRRMRRMRRRLQNNTIFDWLDAILSRSSDIMAALPEESSARAAG
jgi:trehalose-6-phosphate synthase